MIHEAAVNAIGSAGGTSVDVGEVDVKDVQSQSRTALSSLRG